MPVNKLSIPKNPVLKTGEDYYLLRREGIGLIEKMSSLLWTDYNTHDPGITILEALCYAITDIAYRTGWDIKDILTPEKILSPSQPFPGQPFFTARQILTVNPTTPNDFRRLLIDLMPVRDAWMFCRKCVCEASYYAWCDNNNLKVSYRAPVSPPSLAEQVSPLGLYDVLLELENDTELGDLNDYKVEYQTVFSDEEGEHIITLEFRFPQAAIESTQLTTPFMIEYFRFNASKSDKTDIFTSPDYTDEKRGEYLRRHWRDVFYLDLKLSCEGLSPFSLENVSLRIFGDSNVKTGAGADFFKDLFTPDTLKPIVEKIYNKKGKRQDAVRDAKLTLQARRNLDEDYCIVKVIDVEEVGACAEVEVRPDADIELILAKIFLEIEGYFNPAVRYSTLKELLDAGTPVEEIFNGPELTNGFISTRDLDNASLKSVLYVSDVINRLMDIEGVIAVNHFQLTKYDPEGNIVAGAADPEQKGGELEFDKTKTSANWSLYLQEQHQPRLYQRGSRFVFYKNGLPFFPSMDEVNDILTQLKGEAERPKIKDSNEISNDLSVPAGKYRNLENFFPVQYSFPETYGIGQDGLPYNATDKRRGQAAQLKAYLMVFEQLLANIYAQIAHAAELFSLDANSKQTYFAKTLNQSLIQGYDEIIDESLDENTLSGLLESRLESLKRRNRFLDHVMARFGEQFNEYALLLTNLEGQNIALDELIEDKIAFLKAYPLISHDRARAFDYTLPVPLENSPVGAPIKLNQSGIKDRVNRLIGCPDFSISWVKVNHTGVDTYRLTFEISENAAIISGSINVTATDEQAAKLHGYRAVVAAMSRNENYSIVLNSNKYELKLKKKVNQPYGRAPASFDVQADAVSTRRELIAWASGERMIVVEHLLLRPKFPGDALLSSCCCDADPYSFRLSFALPGWNEPFKSNMDMRSFIDRTIKQETPSHLLPKICWIDTGPLDKLEEAWYRWLEANSKFDWTEERLEERLEAILKGNLQSGVEPNSAAGAVCDCAKDILARYGKKFYDWMGKKHAESKLEDVIKMKVPSPDEILCPEKYKSEVAQHVNRFLIDRYSGYVTVSYLLWDVIVLLGSLSNIYPPATLHDWVEGDDENPARLGKTALGS